MWVPYWSISHLNALRVYLEVCGCNSISLLTDRAGGSPEEPHLSMIGFLDLILNELKALASEEAINIEGDIPRVVPSFPTRICISSHSYH